MGDFNLNHIIDKKADNMSKTPGVWKRVTERKNSNSNEKKRKCNAE